jgi:DNA-binding CsgD family transcriptional regulator
MSDPILMEDYRRAIDERSFAIVKAFQDERQATARITVKGRQVGTLGSIVATGRRFSTFAHVAIPLDRSCKSPITINLWLAPVLAFSARLLADGSQSRPTLSFLNAAARSDLLDGEIDATYWARRWRLPPRLARLAVLLMAGVTPKEVSGRLGITIKSARTYTEQLFVLAGVHSRNELARAALRDGDHPPPFSTPMKSRQEQPGERP